MRFDAFILCLTGSIACATSASHVSKETKKRADHVQSDLRNEQFLCAVGYGVDESTAENDAYGALARLFDVDITSTTQDTLRSEHVFGESLKESQDVQSTTKLKANKALSGVQIEQYKENGKSKATACLDRSRASADLKKEIIQEDKTIGVLLDEANNTTETILKLQKLSQARRHMSTRASLNRDLRIIHAHGETVEPMHSVTDVDTQITLILEKIVIYIKQEGTHADTLSKGLISDLSARKLNVTTDSAALNGEHLILSVSSNFQEQNTGNTIYARGEVTIQLLSPTSQQIFGTWSETSKEGSRTSPDAERRALRSLTEKVQKTISLNIESVFFGTAATK